MTNKMNIFCGHCGADNPKQNKFCFNCGSELSKPEKLENVISNTADLDKKYVLLRKKLDKLIEQSGYFIADTKTGFLQFIKEENSDILIFDLGSKNNFNDIQRKKLSQLGFEIIDGNLSKSLILFDAETVLSDLLLEVKEISEDLFLSPPEENFKFQQSFEVSKKPSKSTNTTLSKFEEVGQLDQQTFNRKYGWYIGIVIIIIISIAHFSTPEAEREAEKAKSEVEKNFNAWDGSHIKLVEYTKRKLRDPDSFEHMETKYMDKKDNIVYVTMQFRSKNGFGGFNVSTAYANCDKSTGEVIECNIIDN